MSELEKLLKGVVVDWKPMGEVATINRGRRVTKRQLSPEKKYPVYSGGVTPMGYFEECNQDENTITIVKYGTAGFVNFITEKFWANDVCYCIKPSIKLNNKYLFYILKNNQNHINSLATDAIPAHLPTEVINGLQIPIPSLDIQKEIVRILDTFTELTAELTLEFTARKKQYAYYREQLLSFEEGGVEWKSLREITSLITKGTTPKIYTETGIAFIKTEAFKGSYINSKKLSFIDEETHNRELKRSILKRHDILITIAGATIGKCAIVPKEILPANTNQALAIIRLKENVNVKYIFSLIKSHYMTKYIELNSKGSAQPNLNLEQLNNFSIPYPSPEEQARIVSILDKFDTITNSITEGLPKEIQLRKKQYEYYRNMLLTFPKQESV